MQVKVYLVGAGPGDPELITVKGHRVIAQADSILYDNLAPKALLNHAKEDCEKIFVGKKSGIKLTTQEEINRFLIKEVERVSNGGGGSVVRLKGGDPFVFGRASEEIKILNEKNIPYEVIPGISSYHASLVSAGIPLTDRFFSSSFAVMTGHYRAGEEGKKIQVIPGDTRIYMMVVKNLKSIIAANVESGLKVDTPACLIENATRPEERIISGTLKDIYAKSLNEKVVPPCVLVIGQVVGLRQ